jgi:hypothetical protein
MNTNLQIIKGIMDGCAKVGAYKDLESAANALKAFHEVAFMVGEYERLTGKTPAQTKVGDGTLKKAPKSNGVSEMPH